MGYMVNGNTLARRVEDLHPVHAQNKILKYADDTYLIIGESMRGTTHEELDNISIWAERNNLRLNKSKSREMLVYRRRRGCSRIEPPLIGMQRVTSMVILGVTVADDLTASTHVGEVLGDCSRSLHVLRVLRTHGLPT